MAGCPRRRSIPRTVRAAPLPVGGRYAFAHVSRLPIHGYGGLLRAHTFSAFVNVGGGRRRHEMPR